MKVSSRNFLKLLVATTLLSFYFTNSYGQAIEKNKDSYVLSNDKINPSHFYPKAVIQALDKSTANRSIITTNIGTIKKFGNIKIKVHKCWQAPLSQTPESKALIEVIEEVKHAYKISSNVIFSGWMFASTPSISSLEHPIYDLTLLECKND